MTEKERNIRNRKIIPLSFKYKMLFLLFPFGFGSNLFPIKDYNDSELERFKKYAFDKKYNDAIAFKKIGILLYVLILLILLLFNS